MSVFDPHKQLSCVDSKIVAALERVSEAFKVSLWNEYKKHSLSPLQVQVLVFLLFNKRSNCTVTHLARVFHMTKATLSDAVKTLIKKELVMKEVSQEDSRLFYIMLTAKGKLLAGEVSFFADGIADQIKNLPKEKKELMLEMLLELIDKLHQAGIITLTRMCFTCTHYANKNDGHYCTLLNNPMETVELRIHCTEHQSPLPAVLNLEQS